MTKRGLRRQPYRASVREITRIAKELATEAPVLYRTWTAIAHDYRQRARMAKASLRPPRKPPQK
jgi:hypothetical protein